MTLWTAWESSKDAPRSAVGRGPTPRVSQRMGVGDAHAVENDNETALCGRRVPYREGVEWTGELVVRCRKCEWQAAKQALDDWLDARAPVVWSDDPLAKPLSFSDEDWHEYRRLRDAVEAADKGRRPE